MVIGGASPERVAIPELGVAPLDDPGTDLEEELCDELLNISPLPPSYHLSRNLLRHFRCLRHCIRRHLFLLTRTLSPVSSRRMFHSFFISPAQSYYDPATSDFQDDSGLLPPDRPTTKDQYIAADGDLLLGDPSDLPLLSLPLLPVPVADVSVREPVLEPSVVPPTSRGAHNDR